MSPHRDVLVLGGGVIGLTVAYSLARERLRVAVLDRGDFGQEASWAGAGIIPPGNPAGAHTAYDVLRAHSSALYPALSAELRERTGIDNGYRRCGGLEIADGVGEAASEWRGEGIAFELVRERELLRLEPNLAPGLDAAYHLPDMAQVRNPRHVKALVAGCASWGAELLPGWPVHGFQRHGSRITAALTGLDPLAADRYVIAAGAWSEALLQPLGFQPGIHPVRGQIALLHAEAAPFRHVLVHGKRYLVPRPDGRILAGSTEEDAGFDKRTTATAIRQLLEFAVSLLPSLGEVPL
jgi:glycine oxidase